ncbi:Cof-type HAD-IIB family hydrolase [Paenibacillus protaetiae]|uniref:HAD family phosphatase n=1 Tax=Paenibacillus protaetiae TaxID=2509456 RepID=A0A4P6EXC2_9BACL|nr:Cof-type HAD-IIB family hydrolase [Paenibacillus protaetiae]QAY66389.1 HAD family phosphatase [Paenibacillus protaetiae]
MERKFDLIALDVDGTLLTDHHELTEQTREAVREAAAGGAEIVLCTGRGPSGALPVLEQLGLSGTVITHNGAATILSDNREVLHDYAIEHRLLQPYLEYSRSHGIHFDYNTAFDMFVEGMTPEAEEMYSRFYAQPMLVGPDDQLPDRLLKFTVFGSKEEMDRVEADWSEWPPQLQLIRSGDFFIDVQHPDANKGAALQQLAESRGIPPERVLAIGNYYNDIAMLEFAGLGLAMANSPDRVKEAADDVVLSNEEEGVAYALRKFA